MENTEKRTTKSSSHERKVTAYLRPSVYSKLQSYVQAHGGSASEAINDAVRKLIDPMPPQQKIVPK